MLNIKNNELGSNPVEHLIRYSGKWSIIFLLLTLAITPFKTMLGFPFLLKLRRMIGLFSFFYLCCHFIIWFWLDQELNVNNLFLEIVKRPYILVGFIAFLLMTPLAVTSFNKAIKILGGKLWQKIHFLIYLIGILAVFHFYLIKSSKNNLEQFFIYLSILFVLLFFRFLRKINKK